MTVEEMLQRMSSWEITHWQKLWEIRANERAAQRS